MSEPVWLDENLVCGLHAELVAEYGGPAGIRDPGLLASALARPRNFAAYGEPTLAEMAVSYAFGLVRNHPFVDGNKRVALGAADVFLQLNGFEIIAPEVEAVVMIRDLAAGALDEADLARWIAVNLEPVALS